MPSLRRVRDGAGDSGTMSNNFPCEPDPDREGYWRRQTDEEGNPLPPVYGKPRLNHAIQVGSIAARTYQTQDYWTTTPVVEIIEDTGDYVRFRTTNSEYEWRE